MKLGRRLKTTALAFALFCSASTLAEATQRIALVIGNSSYRPGHELRNPVADARAIAKHLSDLGDRGHGQRPRHGPEGARFHRT